MKKFILFEMIILFLGAIQVLSAQETKQKILLIPLTDRADQTKNKDATYENTRQLLFNTMYNFLSILPFVDMPESKTLVSIQNKSVDSLASSYSPDFIIHGELEIQGEGDSPQAAIVLKVWSRSSKTDIYTKSYSTAIDLDIFDTLDRIIIDTLQATFRIVPRFAVVNFQDFRIGDEAYTILANNKPIAVATNRDFNFNQKILAGNEYNFMIIRESDRAMVLNAFINLKENAFTNISYTASGKALVKARKGTRILLDGKPVEPDKEITNLDVIKLHAVMAMDENNRILEQINFKVLDGQTTIVKVRKTKPGANQKPKNSVASSSMIRPSLRVFALGNAYGGLGLDLEFNKKLWLGLEGSYLYATVQSKNAGFHVISAYLDAGYNLLNVSGIHLGVGLGGGYFYTTPLEQWQLISTLPSQGVVLRSFIQAQWKVLYLRGGIAYNLAFSEPGAYLSLGLKF